MKIPQWQGNAIVFPVPITIVLGKAYVLKTFFFCVSSRLKSVTVFLALTRAVVLTETLHISRSKAKETTCRGKNGTSQNHMTIAKKKHFERKKKYNKNYSLTYKTYNII
jgi:hypothetical protein